jgi:uncharacterized protein (TIGR02680 family)
VTTPPQPSAATNGAARFRPTRCGVINLWDYRDEEFCFADGRLVLRGPNGSGKTKALEVLFPFLFDGRIEPRRLNPFAGEERTMRSNLLYRGQESTYSYVWMEFVHHPGAGEEPTAVTVGVGLRAQRQTDRVARWYFVTDGRVGLDFSLLGPDDRPLTRRQLGDRIGADRITDKPGEHRSAVDARLFGLGLERFEQLLTLILTLRRPQLAKHLDPKGLSRTLSDGLRPLDAALVEEAAHSFSDIENLQRVLDGLVQADQAASAFLAGYATYVRTHARAACDVVTERLTAVSGARSDLVDAITAERLSAQAQREAHERHQRSQQQQQQLSATLNSLKESPAYRSRAQLSRLAEVTAQLAQAAARDQERSARAGGEVDRRRQQLSQAQDAVALAQAEVTRTGAELLETAAEAGIDWAGADSADDGKLTERAVARVTARDEDVTVLRAALLAMAEARRLRDRAAADLERVLQRHADAEAAAVAAEAAVLATRTNLTTALTAWEQRHGPVLERFEALAPGAATPATAPSGSAASGTAPSGTAPPGTAPRPPLVQHLLADLVTTVEQTDRLDTADLPGLVDAAIGPGLQAARDAAAAAREQARQRSADLTAWRAERAAIAAEHDQAPPPFAARTASREDRAGAPFWATVDFAVGVDDTVAAAVEAALHAANLLDAWVSASSADVTESETELRALPPAQRPSGPTLATVLLAEPDGPVDSGVVQSILASVALLDGPPQVDPTGPAPVLWTTGGFRAGVQLGAHSKPHAEYIGTTARARRRAARLAALDLQVAQGESLLAEIRSQIADLEQLIADAGGARRELPSLAPLRTAVRAVDAAAGALRALNAELDERRAAFDQAVAAAGGAERVLHSAGAQRSMPFDTAGVDAVAAAVVRFSRDVSRLDAVRRTAVARAEQRAGAAEELQTAEQVLMDAAEQAEQSQSEHRTREEELRTLRAAVGSTVDQLDRDIRQTTDDLDRANVAERQALQAEISASTAAGRAAERIHGATGTVLATIREAQRDARRLAPYAGPDVRGALKLPPGTPRWPGSSDQWATPEDLTTRLGEEISQNAAAVVAPLPREVEALLAAVIGVTADLRPNESSLKSSRTRVSQSMSELQTQLAAAGHDYRPEFQTDDDVIVVRVADEQGFASIDDFAAHMATARRDQEQLLTEAERRVFEDALLGRLAQQIHDRTTEARDLIADMNREMRRRKMSSGATVGIGWELADALDPPQRAVSRLLERDAALLTPDDLATLRAHFAGRIKDLRAIRPDRPYVEVLAEALDYRAWRTFVLTLVAPDGREDRLTQARHSTLSGGEQSVSLHLPLFAAAHVLLSSASPSCPRLLALDEAFAGIDDPGRGELLGLTAQFDLDLFMTGYDLWATYATVPACAHYDLAHSAVEHTVSSLLMVWDGKELLTDSEIAAGGGDLAAALGSPGTRRRPADQAPTDPGGFVTEE